MIYLTEMLEWCFFLLISSSLLDKKIKLNFKLLSFIIILAGQFIYSVLPSNIQNEYLYFILTSATIIISNIIVLSCAFLDGIFSYLISYIVITIIQFPYAMADIYLFKIPNYIISSIICLLFCIVVALILKRFGHLNKLYGFIFKKTNTIAIILINLFICSIIVSFYFKINIHDFSQVAIFLFFSFMILLLLNIVLFNQFRRIKHNELRLAAYDEYMPMVDELITQVRTRQHNHINEIQAIISLMYTHKDYDSLTAAMKQYIEDSTKASPPEYLLKLNKRIISGFLFQKEQTAASNNIYIHYDFQTFHLESAAPEYILVELFGILLDNAIDAVTPGSVIEVTISSENGKISFQTRNAGHILSPEERSNFFQKGYTTKDKNSKKHSGLGLYRLKNTVQNEYNGTIALWNIGTDILFKITL